MIGCYAESAEQNQQQLFALAMEMMTAQKWAKSA